MASRRSLNAEAGFTLIEVMVASAVLLTGMLGVLTMLSNAATATFSTKAREQGVSLQRELVETVRSIPYDQLSPNSVVGVVQTRPGSRLGDAGADGGWTVRRRDVTFSIPVGVCSVDDPADGTGTHDGATFCATGAGQTTASQCAIWLGASGSIQGTAAATGAGIAAGDCGIDLDLDGGVDNLTEASVGICTASCPTPGGTDASPDDYKRIVTLVRWDRGSGTRYALQSTTVANPGLASAPVVTNLTTTAPTPIVSGTSAAFTATTNREPATLGWSIDGTQKGTATGSGTSRSFTWQLGTVSTGDAPTPGEVLDGSYVIGAKAFDVYGAFGQSRSLTMRLNRRAPYAPAGFEAGRNGGAVDFEWNPGAERDLEGYRVYRDPDSGSDVAVCALTQATTCRDTSPPDGTPRYYVVAVDMSTTGALREGARSTDTVRAANIPPLPPSNLSASLSSGNVVLLWTASPGDPDVSDGIDFYRIYRDGQAYGDRYDRTPDGATVTFTDTKTNGVPHTYSVVAVDSDLAESAVLGPVTR